MMRGFVQGMTVPEFEVDEDDWENHLIEELNNVFRL